MASIDEEQRCPACKCSIEQNWCFEICLLSLALLDWQSESGVTSLVLLSQNQVILWVLTQRSLICVLKNLSRAVGTVPMSERTSGTLEGDEAFITGAHLGKSRQPYTYK